MCLIKLSVWLEPERRESPTKLLALWLAVCKFSAEQQKTYDATTNQQKSIKKNFGYSQWEKRILIHRVGDSLAQGGNKHVVSSVEEQHRKSWSIYWGAYI